MTWMIWEYGDQGKTFFKFTEYLFRNIGKKEKLQDIHNSNEADRFILALFMSHVFI
jgi:hypothetical protein